MDLKIFGRIMKLSPKKMNLHKLSIPRILRIDPFGNVLFLKRALIGVLAAATYSRFNIVNRMHIEGTEHLADLPNSNVMFISNHQTYYADVMAMYHVFSSLKWHFHNSTRIPFYLLVPRVNSYYVAAEETMKQSGLIPKILSYTGAVTVRRSWRAGGKEVKRAADLRAPDKIAKALKYGWVVNFPQGTTTPYAPVRKGTAHIIKDLQPLVVPVVIDGFREAFDKKGLKIRNRGTELSIRFKAPVQFSSEDSSAEISARIAELIEQVPPAGYNPVAEETN